MVPVSFPLVAFVAFADLRSRLLTLGIAQTRLALRSLNRSLDFYQSMPY